MVGSGGEDAWWLSRALAPAIELVGKKFANAVCKRLVRYMAIPQYGRY